MREMNEAKKDTKNITDYERKFIVECIEKVSQISSSAQA